MQSMTGINSAQSAGMPVVVVAANVNEHLRAGDPGIVARVPHFGALDVQSVISKSSFTGRVTPSKFDI